MDFYKDTGIKEQVIKELKCMAKKCNIEKVILFGSRARGDFKERDFFHHTATADDGSNPLRKPSLRMLHSN